MSNLLGAPSQVLEVHNAMLANAQKADFDHWVVYTRPETPWNRELGPSDPDVNWIVGCNFEGWGPSMIFKQGTWFYRDPNTGEDEPMAHGHEEALGCAGCFFTG